MADPQITWDEESPQVSWDEPAKPKAVPPPQQPGFLNTLGRELSSAGESIIGAPGTVYHAFADDLRPDEKGTVAEAISTNQAGNPVQNRIALGLHRTVTQPLAVAGQWWKDAITGKNPTAYEDALSVAPEAIGSAAGNAILGKGIESVPRAAGRVLNVATDPAVRSATSAALKASATELPKAAVKRIPYAGHVAEDVYNAGAKAYRSAKDAIPLDATEENVPFAGGYDPTSPSQMQAWWKERGGVLKSERPEGPIHGPSRPSTMQATPTAEAIPVAQESIPPRYAYRSRNVGEEGIPARSSHAHATMSESEAKGYMEPRGEVEGQPQEVIRVDLSQIPSEQYSILPGPRGSDWIRFNQPVAESGVTRVHGEAIPTKYGVEDIAAGVEKALGGRPLQPDVPLKEQLGNKQIAESTVKPIETALPEGHTRADSSALKSYRYDPGTREMHIQDNEGRVHVYGDVSPETANRFMSAESKGKAWPMIKAHPHVAKIINGKRMPVRPTGR